MTAQTQPLNIVIMTGGTGRTGQQVVKAAMAQFGNPEFNLVIEPDVNSVDAVRDIIEKARQNQSIVCHTLVTPELCEAAAREAKALMVATVDVLGPTIAAIADRSHAAPRNQPGLSYKVEKERFDRMDAVDFTLAHDDGQRMNDLDDADVVLVGVSRASKSVTCFFLAYRGIRAANVPLLRDREPPAELLKLPPEKVVALTMNTRRLQSVREVRAGKWPGIKSEYTDTRQIGQELASVTRLAAAHGWRTIDVSYKAVEEVASEISSMIGAPSRVDAD